MQTDGASADKHARLAVNLLCTFAQQYTQKQGKKQFCIKYTLSGALGQVGMSTAQRVRRYVKYEVALLFVVSLSSGNAFFLEQSMQQSISILHFAKAKCWTHSQVLLIALRLPLRSTGQPSPSLSVDFRACNQVHSLHPIVCIEFNACNKCLFIHE